MKRRKALQNLAIFSGSVITLPAWMGCGSADQPATHQSSFSRSEQEMIAGIADTILPAGKEVGALSMEVDKFLQKLIDDCYEKEVQANVKLQMKALDARAVQTHDKSFTRCDQPQREALLKIFANSPDKNEVDFFRLFRTETIRGFSTSKQVMQEYLGYQVAPGYYHGCAAVKS